MTPQSPSQGDADYWCLSHSIQHERGVNDKHFDASLSLVDLVKIIIRRIRATVGLLPIVSSIN